MTLCDDTQLTSANDTPELSPTVLSSAKIRTSLPNNTIVFVLSTHPTQTTPEQVSSDPHSRGGFQTDFCVIFVSFAPAQSAATAWGIPPTPSSCGPCAPVSGSAPTCTCGSPRSSRTAGVAAARANRPTRPASWLWTSACPAAPTSSCWTSPRSRCPPIRAPVGHTRGSHCGLGSCTASMRPV